MQLWRQRATGRRAGSSDKSVPGIGWVKRHRPADEDIGNVNDNGNVGCMIDLALRHPHLNHLSNGKIAIPNNAARGELALASRMLISTLGSSPWAQILLLEDNSARAQRRKTAGLRRRTSNDVVIRFHRIRSNGISLIAERTYSP